MTDTTIGVMATGRIALGLVTGHELAAPLHAYPPPAAGNVDRRH
jgi:hypothetical protein